MDSTLKQMLDSFRLSVDNFAGSLDPANGKLVRARELLDMLTSRAEEGADISSISTDPAFGELGGLIAELASEPPAQGGSVPAGGTAAPPVEGEVPPASVPAAGYHMAYESMDSATRERNAPYYERIFRIEEEAVNAIHFNTMLEEDGVLLEMSRRPLMDSAEDTLRQSKETHSPTVEFQQGLVLRTYADVRSMTELEYEGTRMAEFSNVEHPWDGMYIQVVGLLPACAQAIESFGPTDENVAKLRRSRSFMADFMGMTWESVFRDPRYLLFWNEVFWPKVPEEKRTAHGVDSPEGWRDVLKEKYYDPFLEDEPAVEEDPGRSVIRFWRKDHPMREVLELLRDPPRPAVELDREPI